MTTITLTESEVKTLCTVCRFITGSPTRSPRGDMDFIHHKLGAQCFPEIEDLTHGTLAFDNYPREKEIQWKGKPIPASLLDALIEVMP